MIRVVYDTQYKDQDFSTVFIQICSLRTSKVRRLPEYLIKKQT